MKGGKSVLARLMEFLTRIGIVRLLIAYKAFASVVSGYIVSRIRAHSRRVYEKAKWGTDKSVQLDGLELHYVELGQGPPLLLIPGAFSTYRSWNRVALQLAQDFTIIALDPIGAGSSDKPGKGFSYTVEEQAGIIAKLIVHLQMGPVCLAGVSYGGSIALSIATKYPELVQRIVCIEGGVVHPGELPHRVEDALSLPIIGDIFIGFLKVNLINRWLMQLLMGKWYPHMTEEDKQVVLEAIFYDTAGGTRVSWYKQSRASQYDPEFALQAEQVTIPVAYLYGMQSVFVDAMQKNLQFFQGKLPGARVIPFADGIHDLHVQKPRDVAAIIKEFCIVRSV